MTWRCCREVRVEFWVEFCLSGSRLGHPGDEDHPEGGRAQRIPHLQDLCGKSHRAHLRAGQRHAAGQGGDARSHEHAPKHKRIATRRSNQCMTPKKDIYCRSQEHWRRRPKIVSHRAGVFFFCMHVFFWRTWGDRHSDMLTLMNRGPTLWPLKGCPPSFQVTHWASSVLFFLSSTDAANIEKACTHLDSNTLWLNVSFILHCRTTLFFYNLLACHLAAADAIDRSEVVYRVTDWNKGSIISCDGKKLEHWRKKKVVASESEGERTAATPGTRGRAPQQSTERTWTSVVTAPLLVIECLDQ